MCNAVMRWAAELRVGNSTEKNLLLALADYANDVGKCWPSLASLMERTEFARNTVMNGLKGLLAKGLIADSGGRVGRTGGVRVWLLNLAASSPLPKLRRRRTASAARQTVMDFPTDDQIEQGEVADLVREAVADPQHGTTIEPSGEPPREPSVIARELNELTLTAPEALPAKKPRRGNVGDDPGFLAFAAAYPLWIDADGARRAWRKAIREATAEQIMAGLATYRFSEDPTFIPHPATWLNKKRWIAAVVRSRGPVLSAVAAGMALLRDAMGRASGTIEGDYADA